MNRKLAGDNRAGSLARAEAGRRQLAFILDGWRWLAVAVVVAARGGWWRLDFDEGWSLDSSGRPRLPRWSCSSWR